MPQYDPISSAPNLCDFRSRWMITGAERSFFQCFLHLPFGGKGQALEVPFNVAKVFNTDFTPKMYFMFQCHSELVLHEPRNGFKSSSVIYSRSAPRSPGRARPALPAGRPPQGRLGAAEPHHRGRRSIMEGAEGKSSPRRTVRWQSGAGQ